MNIIERYRLARAKRQIKKEIDSTLFAIKHYGVDLKMKSGESALDYVFDLISELRKLDEVEQ